MPDRVKESLFSMLGKRIEGAQVVDLFAGSGAMGLEAISRGAAGCVLVEMDKVSAQTLEQNVALLGCQERARVVRGDALGLSVVARCPRPTDLIFMDPPYPLVEHPAGWARVVQQASALVQVLSDTGFLILRTPYPHMLTELEEVPAQEGRPARRFKKGGDKRPGNLAVADERTIRRASALPPGKGARGGAGAGFKGKPGARGTGEDDQIGVGDDVVELTEAELAAALGGASAEEVARVARLAAATARAEHAPAKAPVAPDLQIPGARGPETHRYGSMQVHFYMKG